MTHTQRGPLMTMDGLARATFAAGCFWGVEASFREIEGVVKTSVGYTGGRTPEPSYEQVCSGTTGHAESVELWFDPAVVTYSELLETFWSVHDPTTPDRQGWDFGTQYRAAIFFHDPEHDRRPPLGRKLVERALQSLFELAVERSRLGTEDR